MNREKASYTPSKESRFEISPDAISYARIRKVMEIHRELSDKYPYHVAISLFGSLTKGKRLDAESARVTDLDMVIFVDRDDFKKEGRPGLGEEGASDAWRTLQREIRQVVRGKVEQTAQSTGADDPRSLLKDLHVWPIAHEGTFSIGKTVDQTIACGMYGDEQQEQGYKEQLARYFHLDIGGGLLPYQQSYLKQLETKAHPDRDWQIVHEAVTSTERREDLGSEPPGAFPRTYEQARAYFGLDSGEGEVSEARP